MARPKKWFYRKRKKEVYVYYPSPKTGKNVMLPREQTRHLDPLSDEEVRAWVKDWLEKNGIKVDFGRKSVLMKKDELRKFWEDFREDHRNHKEIKDTTDRKATALFELYIVAYFVTQNRAKDVRKWAPLVPKFNNYMLKKGIGLHTRKKCLWLLRRFSEYLVTHGHLDTIWSPKIPSRNRKASTPLPKAYKPEEILNIAKKMEIRGLQREALIVLIGYFGSLRPSETYALNRSDLLTGANVVINSNTFHRLQAAKLGSRLGINVKKALSGSNPNEQLKTESSEAVVTVWSPFGARRIADIVKKMPEGRLFPWSRDHTDKRLKQAFKKIDEPYIKPHDFRRASALHLGRTLGLELFLLQDHMRHSEISTTMLYTRRPTDQIKQVDEQNFDDVG